MSKTDEIIEELTKLAEIYLENAKMDDVILDWGDGSIDLADVLEIITDNGLYDLNFTEEQTNDFLALISALNQEQVSIDEAKLSKETKKGDNIMEKEVKPMKEEEKQEKLFFARATASYHQVGVGKTQEEANEDAIDALSKAFHEDNIDIMSEGHIETEAVTKEQSEMDDETIKGILGDDEDLEEGKKPVMEVKKPSDKIFDERARSIIYNAIVLLQEYGGEDFEDMEFLLNELGITSPAEVREVKLMMNEGLKKPVMESKKPIKEGVRLIYNPRDKKEVKAEGIPMGPDGEPLPVDIKESNTHTKLRLFKVK